jgi:hypothetical protein
MLKVKFSVLIYLPVIIIIGLTQCGDRTRKQSSGPSEKQPPVVDFIFNSAEDVPSRSFIQEGTPLPARKPLFAINGKPFVPVIMHVVARNLPDKEGITKYINEGYNAFCLELGYSQIGNRDVVIFIERCREEAIPLIVELHPGGLHAWLMEHEEGNMWFSPEYPSDATVTRFTRPETREYETIRYDSRPTHINYFPDYANPETWAEYRRQLSETLNVLRPYFKDPIVSFSLGAYDHFHIPEAETHSDFACISEYPIDVRHQTWLPYGPHVEKEYVAWINAHKDRFDMEITDEIRPPLSLGQADGFEHWRSWIIYRRYHVRRWIEKTHKLVKEISGLPVTMTYDVNWSPRDSFGSPAIDVADILDYVVTYMYRTDSTTDDEIALRMKGLDHLFRMKGLPVITLFEFTSQVTRVPISAKEYVRQTAPYVSGMQYQIHASFKGEDLKKNLNRSFRKGTDEISKENLLLASIPVPGSAIFLNPEEIFLWETGYDIGKELLERDEDFDIIYDIELAEDYANIYIPFTEHVFNKDYKLQQEIDKLKEQGKEIVLRDFTFYDL